MHFRQLLLPVAGFALLIAGCASGEGEEEDGSDEAAQVAQAQSIRQRPDGLFDVVCRDGRREVATQDEILANTICARPAPWTPGSGAAACASPASCTPGDRVLSTHGCPPFTSRWMVCTAACRWAAEPGACVSHGG